MYLKINYVFLFSIQTIDIFFNYFILYLFESIFIFLVIKNILSPHIQLLLRENFLFLTKLVIKNLC